jgi:tetratricopeptide (TPR) repeat protein/transcriptional regulator with XRE-family HTH domain
MFGDIIRTYRRRLGLTQEDLAARTGMHSRTVAKIESGQIARPRPSTVRLLADAFALAGPDRAAFLASAADTEPPVTAASGPPEAVLPAPEDHRRLNQLPADVAAFTGRADELHRLTALLDSGASAGARAAVITAIGGTAGVGKTALAVHWGQRMRDHFPDGQLYVNLRGYDRDQPMTTADALAGFLRALGVPSPEVPTEVAERAGLYRSLLDGRRMLVLLDNASSVEQVRDLLPGSPSCFALVTSRDSLGGLVARHGAHRIELDLLPLVDALDLQRSLIGARVDAEPAEAHRLAELCACLPLALRVAAELAIARPESSLAGLVAELAAQEGRLTLLEAGGDSRTAVSAVFSWSYESLPAEARLMFRLLSLHPGEDLNGYAAAALAGTTPARARATLDVLVRAHLVRRTGTDRYGMHDLLRVYATGVAQAVDTESDRLQWSLALFEHYLDTTQEALTQLRLTDRAGWRPEVTTRSAGPELTSPESAQSWLDTELPNLIAIASVATALGLYAVPPALSRLLAPYVVVRGLYPEGLTIHERALAAVDASSDDAARARILAFLGAAYGQLGEHARAAEMLGRAVELARATEDLGAEAVATRNFALAQWHLGNHAGALQLSERAIEVSRACGDTIGAAVAQANWGNFLSLRGRFRESLRELTGAAASLADLGTRYAEARAYISVCEIYRQLGWYGDALHYGQMALAIAGEVGDRVGEGLAMRELGSVHLSQGDLDTAAGLLERAVVRMETGFPYGGHRAVSLLGEVRRLEGRLAEARELHDRAVAFYLRPDHRTGLAPALMNLALVHASGGEYEIARSVLAEALNQAVRHGLRFDEAQAQELLGDVAAVLGSPKEARCHWAEALAIRDAIEPPPRGERRRMPVPESTVDIG